MEKKQLSGIERELVLQYLIDGNVPVTLTPLDSVKSPVSENKSLNSLNSAVFPVALSGAIPIALRGEKVRAQKSGLILLENPPQSVLAFSGKKVKVEFYFNRVGLYFHSDVTETSNGLQLQLPDNINYIEDIEDKKVYDFTASFYFECRTQSDLNINCIPWSGTTLFMRPAWKEIPLQNQNKAKKYLEIFVEQAKVEKNAGNGIQLIPVCNFLTYTEEKRMESLQDRVKPVSILYVDHERIVFGNEMKGLNLILGAEYALKLSFNLKEGPIESRDLFVTCKVNKIYNDVTGSKYCADCVYTSLQEEDRRYLYEKATSRLFA